jgi:hypothetical protein
MIPADRKHARTGELDRSNAARASRLVMRSCLVLGTCLGASWSACQQRRSVRSPRASRPALNPGPSTASRSHRVTGEDTADSGTRTRSCSGFPDVIMECRPKLADVTRRGRMPSVVSLQRRRRWWPRKLPG